MDGSDETLLFKAIRGDCDALGTLLEDQGPRLRSRLANGIDKNLRSTLSENDILQVTYLDVFLRIDRFKPAGSDSFAAWLNTIAENNLRDAIKALTAKKRPDPRRRAQPLSDESYRDLLEALSGTGSTPSRHAARGEIRDAVESAIAELPTDYAAVVRMYDLEGRSAGEVAETIGRSQGAVYMLRARAHDSLRELLGPGSRFFSDSA